MCCSFVCPWLQVPVYDGARFFVVLNLLQVSEFMGSMTAVYGACQPDVLLAYEVYKEEIATWLFPINVLRNYARLQVSHMNAAVICIH